MEIIKIDEKVYEVLEYGNLLGNISHVRSYWDVLAEVVHSGKDSGDNLYAVVRYLDDGGVDMFWEKDLHDQGVLPLKLLDEDCVVEECSNEDCVVEECSNEDCVVEECSNEEFFTGKVVGVRRCDDHDLVEFMVPPGMGEYLFIGGGIHEFLLEE
jgi:hypothetical protein